LTETSNILDQVLEYKHKELSVVALISKSKKPENLKWEEYQHALPSEDQLKQWFSTAGHPNNVGIITGTVSKIFAIDIDGREAQAYFHTKIEQVQDKDILTSINRTMKIKTGSGNINIIIGFNPEEFDTNKKETKNRILWKRNETGHSEIRIKGEGGYIVAPPSIHPNGNKYELINGLDIVTFSKAQLQNIFDVLSSRKESRNKFGQDTQQYWLDDETISDIVEILKPYCQSGVRNDFLMYLSGWIRKENVSMESARKVIDGLTEDDEEKQERFATLEATYNKADLDDVIGYTGLLTILSNMTSDEEAIQILNQVEKLAFFNDYQNSHDKKGQRNKKQSKKLIELAESNTERFFKDQCDVPHAKVKVGNHHEIFPIKSRKSESYITKLFFDQSYGEKIPTQESLNNAIRVLHAKTEFGDQKETVHLRSAWGTNGEINYDLTDEEWRQIKITKDGRHIIRSNDSKLLFTRFNQTSQLEPDKDYSSDIFDKYLNLMNISDPQHRLLLKVMTICSFVPDIPHPICIPYGEQGSCKSTFCEFQKRLIDPSRINLLTIPKDKSEFVQQLHHNYLVVYDNVSYLPAWFSDEVCKAVTGVGNSKRKLYSDDEDVIVNYKRCIIINGINNNLTEPDALDRSVLIELERIKSTSRKEQSRVEIEFEELRPKLLGYIFDILVKTLQIKPSLELSHLPRMADFAVWGEAVARAMDYKPMEFLDAYNRNIGKQNIEAIESNQLAQAIVKFVSSWYDEEKKTCWISPTSKVLENLNKTAQTYNIDTSNKEWPKASNSLTKRLRPLLSNLREGLGIHVVMGRITTGSSKNKNTSIIRIWKESPPSPLPPLSAPRDQNYSKESGGSLFSGDTTATESHISPPQKSPNHAQKWDSGDSGYSGGFIPTLDKVGNVNNDSHPLSDRYVAFDFEWSSRVEEQVDINNLNNQTQITAAAFLDNLGNSSVLHISDFSSSDNPEYELIIRINQVLIKYNYSIGWYSSGIAVYHEDTQEHLDGFDSDLAVLHSRCLANGIDSIIDISTKVPRVMGKKHIDLHSVFAKPMIQTTIFKNSYRTLKLDEVSKAVLGNGNEAGKYNGLSGQDIRTLPIEEQKKYVLRDAELVMQLSQHNNSEVLDAMKAISEVTGLEFEKVCRTGLSTWWATIYDQAIINGECKPC
jgi:Bifunctional DNA primase/polymerase, N-terminal